MDNVCKIHVVEITLMIKFIYETVDFKVKYENFIKKKIMKSKHKTCRLYQCTLPHGQRILKVFNYEQSLK